MLSRTDESCIASAEATFTYADLASDPFGLRSLVGPGRSVSIRSDFYQGIGAAFAVLDGYASRVALVPHELAGQVAADVEVALGTAQIIAASETNGSVVGSGVDSVPPADAPTRWSVYTSGTTGTPKTVDHTLASLTRTSVANPTNELRWGAMYDPNRMAGLQVLLQAMVAGQPLYAVDRAGRIADQVDELIEADVNALSATPSLWRRILQTPHASRLGLTQITLGGEIADQQILDGLASTFPDARIVHVFASTEVGAAFSVTDRLAGFPASYLEEPPRGIELTVRDGVLWVRSPEVSVVGDDGFVETGDLVEVVDDRVRFLGRASGVVNVGGTNVAPEAVETILREHPGIEDVTVSAKPNSMTGNVLIAEVVLGPDVDAAGASKWVRKWVRDRAPVSHVPATVRVVDEVRLSSTGKSVR